MLFRCPVFGRIKGQGEGGGACPLCVRQSKGAALQPFSFFFSSFFFGKCKNINSSESETERGPEHSLRIDTGGESFHR